MTDPFHHAHPVSATQIAAELARELEQRRRVYPGRVQDGRMTQAEADYQIRLAEAWAEDVARLEHGKETRAADFLAGKLPSLPHARHGFTWRERREGLARELAFRARIFPRRVSEGALAQADADHRTACLAALAARYDDGFDWKASNGARPDVAAAVRDPAAREALAEWNHHREAVEARNTPAKQEEMAL